jgi:thiol-disulfide isomerase/thioredoxin
MLKYLSLAVVASVLLIAPAIAGPDTATKAEAAALGQKVPDFTIEDEDGRPFQLYKSKHSRKEIEASVLAAAAKFGAAKDAALNTKLADLAGLKDEEGDLDGEKRAALASAAGSYYGLAASEDSTEAFATLTDVADWIAKANDGPIVFVCWSPNCPSVKRQNDRMMEFAANAGVRVYCVASNYKDQKEHYDAFRESFEFTLRVFPDRDQRVTDILGGKKTPHYFLVGADHVLRYHGALDNDPMGFMDEDERQDWLLDAVTAVRAGKEVAHAQSDPAG